MMLSMIPALFVHVPLQRIPGYLDVMERSQLGVEVLITSEDLDSDHAAHAQTARALAATGLPVTLHAPYLGPGMGHRDSALRAAALARLEATLRLAEGLSPRNVVVHPGFDEVRYGTPPRRFSYF